MNAIGANQLTKLSKEKFDVRTPQEELDIVHQTIAGIAKLGGELLALPLSICHVSDVVINNLKNEGYAINIENRDVEKGKFYDTLYISWYRWNILSKTNSSVIYRPQRGMLEESVRDAMIFENAVKMKEYLVNHYKGIFGRKMFTADDIVLHGDEEGYKDERIGWEDVRHVCVKRMGNEVFEKPACIGMWATKWK